MESRFSLCVKGWMVGVEGEEGFALSFHDIWMLSKYSGGESLDKRLIYKGQMLDSLLLFLMPRRNKLQGFRMKK